MTVNVNGENRLLAALPQADRKRMLAQGERLSLGLKHVLYEPGAIITHVYFPLSGVMSLVITVDERVQIEVGTIGNEGLVGTPLFLGAEKSPTFAFSQVPGDVIRMKAATFMREVRRSKPLERLVERYTQAMINQISQSVACNHVHPVEQRACRWLLMCHDRTGTDEMQLTQEFLSQMLGVRRATVTIVASMLQREGLISYSRGKIRVDDRKGLEKGACECYGIVRREFDRLLGSPS